MCVEARLQRGEDRLTMMTRGLRERKIRELGREGGETIFVFDYGMWKPRMRGKERQEGLREGG